MKIPESTRRALETYAARYETEEFLAADPARFLRRAESAPDREALAFAASCLSFGSRPQFLGRIEWLAERSDCRMDAWIRTGAFARDVPPDDSRCFYRFFTFGTMHRFFSAYRALMEEHGTLGGYVRRTAGGDGFGAVAAICRWFAAHGSEGAVPKDTSSACKRVCMFLRWMVRSGSPVDLGLWADFIDRRTLVVPLDVHVLRQARRLGLLSCTGASMAAARRLTAALAEVFPDDPLRGDFALFGYGVNS